MQGEDEMSRIAAKHSRASKLITDVRRPRIYNTIEDAILQIQHGVLKWLPCLRGFNVYRLLPNQ